MWRTDSLGPRKLVLIGRSSIQLWVPSAGGLRCLDSYEFRPAGLWEFGALTEAAIALCGAHSVQTAVAVVESAFMPITLAPTSGLTGWAKEISAVIAHRLNLQFGQPKASPIEWDIRFQSKLGSSHALGYGMHPELRTSLADVSSRMGLRWQSWQPALAWGLARVQASRHWSSASGWLIWPESDRKLLLRVHEGQAVSLNPALLCEPDSTALVRAVEIECHRLGLVPGLKDVVVATWTAPPQSASTGRGMRWFDIGGSVLKQPGLAAEASPMAPSVSP